MQGFLSRFLFTISECSSRFLYGFLSGFTSDFFRNDLWFLEGSLRVSCRVSYQDFFTVSLGFTKGLSRVSFRIQTGEKKAKENDKQRDSKDGT